MSIRTALPPEFLTRLNSIVAPQHLSAVHTSLQQNTAPTTLRINTLLTDINSGYQHLIDANLTPSKITWHPPALQIPTNQREQLLQHPLYEAGHYYIQNLASMLPPLILDPQPGEQVLDLTAAPGSKTSQIACLMQNQGRIAAVEKVKKRFFKLQHNLQQQGVTCADLYCKDGTTIWRHCQHMFDRVLLDAPCSSESRFNIHDPKTFEFWGPQKIKSMARKQWALLCSAIQCVKPGGTLVYSTCTYAPEENELQIAKLLKKMGDQIELVAIDLPISNYQPGLTEWNGKSLPSSLKHTVRIIPDGVMSGFFIACVRPDKY